MTNLSEIVLQTYSSDCKLHVQMGRYHQAMIQYQRIVSWLEMECGVTEGQQQAIRNLLLVAHLNLSLCHLRLREYSHVLENCNKVRGHFVRNYDHLWHDATSFDANMTFLNIFENGYYTDTAIMLVLYCYTSTTA